MAPLCFRPHIGAPKKVGFDPKVWVVLESKVLRVFPKQPSNHRAYGMDRVFQEVSNAIKRPRAIGPR
jgi:hypothetical protein